MLIPFGTILSMRTDAQVVLGLKAGPNFCTLRESFSSSGPSSNAPDDLTATGVGYHLGMFISSSRQANAAFRAELLYSVKSASEETDVSHNDGGVMIRQQSTTSLDFAYMEVPLLLSIQPAKGLSVLLGIAPAFILDATFEVEGATTITSQGSTPIVQNYSSKASSTQNIAAVAFEGQVGAAYDLSNGLHFGARYLHDLNDIGTEDGVTDHFGVIQLSLGYCFLGKPMKP